MKKGVNLFVVIFIALLIGGSGGYYFGKSRINETPAPFPKLLAVIPSIYEARNLVNNSMGLLSASIRQGSMKLFYKNISGYWKARTNVKDLDRSFRRFISTKVDLTSLGKLKPVIVRRPCITRGGSLVIEGFYPTRPYRVIFRQRYRRENGKWKLSGFFIQLHKIKKINPGSSQKTGNPANR